MARFELSNTVTPPRLDQAGFTNLLQERAAYKPIGYTINDLSAISGHDGNCPPYGLVGVASQTRINSSKPSKDSSGRRKRRDRGQPLCDRTFSSFLENISNSPKKTPTKSQPFTPSAVSERCFSPLHIRTFLSWYDHIRNLFLSSLFCQFCNISATEHLNLDDPALTSTPVCGQRCLLATPLLKENTPKHQKENDG